MPIVSTWGSTETAPLATSCHFESATSAVIGLPVPGVELKLVPRGPKLEVRVKGLNVTPGYWKRPELTAQAFDDEGFYVIGDAVRPVDPQDFELGLLFDGRISEDFKLTSGTSEPASIDAGEVTDKGYINQRVVLERRHALVEALYTTGARDDLIDMTG